MTNIFQQNQEYLGKSYPGLLAAVKSTDTFKQQQILDGASSVIPTEDSKEIQSLANIVNSTIFSQIKKAPPRVLLPRVLSSSNEAEWQDSSVLLKQSIDGTQSLLLDALPSIANHNYDPDTQNTYLAKDLILLGALGLAELDQLIDSCLINNLLVIDDGYESLAKLTKITSFRDIIEKCKDNNISLHFIVEKDFDSLITLLKRQLACEMFSSCFGFYLITSPPPSAILESVNQWFKSQEGMGEFIKGLLGQETDEVNQSIHSIYNDRLHINREILEINKHQYGDVVIVASGPSFDHNIEELKSLRDSVTLISAGSAIGALLRNGLRPDYAVLLEMSSDVFRDMCELIAEGFDLSEITLIASVTIDPRIASLFKSFITYQRPVSTALLFFDQEHESALPYAGPQALNAAFEVSLFFNAKSITLVGADLSSPNSTDVRSRDAVGLSPRDFDIPKFGTNNRTVFTDSGLLLTREALEAAMEYVKCPVYRVGEGLPLNHQCVTQYRDLLSLINANKVSFDSAEPKKFEPVSVRKVPAKSQDISSLVDSVVESFANFKSESLDLLMREKGWTLVVSQYFSRSLSMGDMDVDLPEKIYRRMLRLPLFYALQPLHDSSIEDSKFADLVESYSQTLDLINDFLVSYVKLVKNISSMKVVPPYDPNFIANLVSRA